MKVRVDAPARDCHLVRSLFVLNLLGKHRLLLRLIEKIIEVGLDASVLLVKLLDFRRKFPKECIPQMSEVFCVLIGDVRRLY